MEKEPILKLNVAPPDTEMACKKLCQYNKGYRKNDLLIQKAGDREDVQDDNDSSNCQFILSKRGRGKRFMHTQMLSSSQGSAQQLQWVERLRRYLLLLPQEKQ